MAADAHSATARRLVVDTNVFELCELKTLAWRAFGPQRAASDASPSLKAFAVFATAIAHAPTALTAWQEDESDHPTLWVFSVNNAQTLPTAADSVAVVSDGAWSADDSEDETNLVKVQPQLFTALRSWLETRLLSHHAFRRERALLCLNEARFVYRRPSLTRVNQFDVFLDDAYATSGVVFHFTMLPNKWLCVNVEMIHHDASASTVSPEIGDLANAWQRLMGLPGNHDFSMIDVWHADDMLAARIVAETKYDDILPRFRAFARRHLGRRKGIDGGDDGSGDVDDSTGKPDGKENDGDDDHDGANDGDDDARRNGKKKRRKPGNEAAENDESIIPISPDTHVNSPDAGGPVVGMTFPRDRPLLLHTDHDIHIFKRRRRKKTEPMPSNPRSTVNASLSFGPLAPVSATNGTKSILPIIGRARSVSQTSAVPPKPETPKTPALSLAVSLVASLTQDEEREALDSKPIKTHPLLQALDDYVEKEMTDHAMRHQATSAEDHAKLVPNAPGFSPSVDEKKKTQVARLSSVTMSYEQLKSQLLSDRFKRYLTGYYPRDFSRSKRQQRRERERKLLLGFDETKLVEYGVTAFPTEIDHSVRDHEIALGIHLAVVNALVPWRLLGVASSRWIPYASPTMRAADERDTLTHVHHMTPYLMELQGVVKEKNDGGTASDEEAGEVHDPWMTLERYCAKTIRDVNDDSADEMHAKPIDDIPRLCVASVESALHVEIPAISEYTLRGFQPVAAAKPVDYAIICPHSPAQWLGTLTLSYLSMFRSVYAQSSMGDQVGLDLTSVANCASVNVDAANATLLVECATKSADAFAPFRAAGEMLRPLLSQGSKRKQAFSRSPVANVIYLVAPFRRSDVRHKMWLLGAFGRGLFGDDGVFGCEDDWGKSVTVELLYLEDLIAVSVDANPYVLLPAAIALYDRIFERVTLKPIVNGDSATKSRYVCERLYHLAETPVPAEGKSDSTLAFVHAGYAVSSDGKWLLAAFSDALGAVLETRAIVADTSDLSSALLSFVESALEFVALMGEKVTLVISQLLPSSRTIPVVAEVWRGLAEQDGFQQLTRRFESVVSRILVCQTSFVDKDTVQLRPVASSIVKVNEHEGVLVTCPDDSSVFQERSRVSNNKWLRSTEHAAHHTTVLRVRLVHSIPVLDTTAVSRDDLEGLLTNWLSLSYLTTHPIFLQRQSPLPLHLTAVDELYSELELLVMQITTDPLALRR